MFYRAVWILSHTLNTYLLILLNHTNLYICSIILQSLISHHSHILFVSYFHFHCYVKAVLTAKIYFHLIACTLKFIKWLLLCKHLGSMLSILLFQFLLFSFVSSSQGDCCVQQRVIITALNTARINPYIYFSNKVTSERPTFKTSLFPFVSTFEGVLFYIIILEKYIPRILFND